MLNGHICAKNDHIPCELLHLTYIHLYCISIRMVSKHLFRCNCRRRHYNGTIITRNQNTAPREIKQKILLLPEVRAIQLHMWMISIISLTVLKWNTVFHAYCLWFLSPKSSEWSLEGFFLHTSCLCQWVYGGKTRCWGLSDFLSKKSNRCHR